MDSPPPLEDGGPADGIDTTPSYSTTMDGTSASPIVRHMSMSELKAYVRPRDQVLRRALWYAPPCRDVEKLMDATVPARVELRFRSRTKLAADALSEVRRWLP